MIDRERCLMLLTKEYPYGVGEDFIQNEIDFLAARFKKITIVSTSVKKTASTMTRKIPSNVEVVRINDYPNLLIRILVCIGKGVVSWNKRLKDEIKKCKSIKEVVFTAYYYGRCKRNQSLISKYIKEKPNIVYSYWFSDLPLLSILLKEQWSSKEIVLLSRAHGYDLYEDRNIVGSIPFREQVLKELNIVFPCSVDGERYLKDKYPDYSPKIIKSYLGTNDYGLSLGIENDILHIASCSAIIPLKRVQLIAETVRILEINNVRVKWTCIGDGTELDQIKQYARNNIKKSEVAFVGRLTNAEVLDFYKNNHIDFFVNVSEKEGLPVSIMEAISFGIPCVATDVGGTHEIVIDGITGKLLPKDITAEMLAEIITDLFSSCFNKDVIREFWLNNFSAKENYTKFVEIITNL